MVKRKVGCSHRVVRRCRFRAAHAVRMAPRVTSRWRCIYEVARCYDDSGTVYWACSRKMFFAAKGNPAGADLP